MSRVGRRDGNPDYSFGHCHARVLDEGISWNRKVSFYRSAGEDNALLHKSDGDLRG